MTPQPEAVGNPEKGNDTYCLAGSELYLLAFPDGGTCDLALPEGKAVISIQWFNPRNGRIQKPTETESATITCPDRKDWVAIVRTK